MLYIATIEKASGLVNALLETDRMQELGLVVVDEVHMLAEPGGRGAMLESIITKLRYAARRYFIACVYKIVVMLISVPINTDFIVRISLSELIFMTIIVNIVFYSIYS